MKRALGLIAVAALFVTGVAAQTDANLGGSCTGGTTKTSTAGQDALTPQARLIDNAVLCKSKGLPKTCTQQDLDGVSGCAGGACGTIYAGTLAGNRSYALDRMFACYFDVVGNKITSTNAHDIGQKAAEGGAITATNGECSSAIGGSACSGGNGCTRYQIACCAVTGGTSNDCR